MNADSEIFTHFKKVNKIAKYKEKYKEKLVNSKKNHLKT